MICINCVTPVQLKKLVESKGYSCQCEYCGRSGIAIEAKLLFDFVIERVDENIAKLDDLSSFEEVNVYELGSDKILVQTIDVVLSEWFELGEDAYFDDLLAYIPDIYKTDVNGCNRHFFYDDGLLDRNFYENRWAQFIDEIRHLHRFFNPKAREFLDSVFGLLSTSRDELKDEVILTVKRGQELYRARTALDYASAKKIADDPATQLGPTPRDKTGSQRMTPNGISALYCSFERETCLSEIRSITGDNVISVAITPTSSLKLLDFTKLRLVDTPKLTVLDENYLDLMHLKTFISSLVKKMSMPKGRNDELSYLSSQVVFEYLRLRYKSQVDGLVFPSVQTGGKGTNIVLFPEASAIGTNFYNRPDEFFDYIESAVPVSSIAAEKLEIVAKSIRFHKIKSIETIAEEFCNIDVFFMSENYREQLGLK